MNDKINKEALESVITIMKLLSNPARLGALCLMLEDEISVNDLAGELDIEQTALSQHLKLLRDNNLVEVRRDHRTLYYRTTDAKLSTLIGVLKELYCS
ncbi:MAG: DNA-binding transcriptional ArsR family regulator [Alphaproteobacteria bacterium]|jgi:DNA-binding transcriptional ArsR family regulator